MLEILTVTKLRPNFTDFPLRTNFNDHSILPEVFFIINSYFMY